MFEPDDSMNRLKRIDPVDGDRLVTAWSETTAASALLEEITSMSTSTIAPPTTPRPRSDQTRDHSVRRRRSRLVLAAAAIALTVGIGASFLPGADKAYALSESADGTLHVSVLAGFRDGEALARDLRSRGVDAEVNTVAASPSMVGTAEIGTFDSGPFAGIEIGADGTPGVFEWTIDPAVFNGTLRVTVFVEAEDGEPFGAAQEIFEPGEKLGGLHCALGEPMRAVDVAGHLDSVGLRPVWNIVTPTSDPSITDSTTVAAVPDGVVLSGYAVDDSTARFDILRDGDTLDVRPAGYISDFPCSATDAAPWK